MSRSARLGGKEKAKPQVPITVVTPDIVPGKFTENDWFAMLEKDAAEDFVHDYIDEILAFTMESIHKLYIQRQIVPFTVFHAANEMMHIVEWKFVIRDEGEAEDITDAGWVQDEEPHAAVMDSWSQGAVPLTEVVRSIFIEEMDEEMYGSSDGKYDARTVRELSLTGQLLTADVSRRVSELGFINEKEEDSTKQPPDSKKSKKPKDGKHRSKELPRAVPRVEKTVVQPSKKEASPEKTIDSGSKVPALSVKDASPSKAKPKGSSAYRKSCEGFIKSFVKLDPDTLPSHRVSVRFQIVDQSVHPVKSLSEQFARLTGMGRSAVQIQACKRRGSTRNTEPTASDRGKNEAKPKKSFIPLDCSPQSVLESINVVPGVTIIESGRSKKLQKRIYKPTVDYTLADVHPISSTLQDRSVSVADFLDQGTPSIRPLGSSKPLPPITTLTVADNSFDFSTS